MKSPPFLICERALIKHRKFMDSLTASTTFTTNSEPHLNKFSLNKLLICIYICEMHFYSPFRS